MNICFKILSL